MKRYFSVYLFLVVLFSFLFAACNKEPDIPTQTDQSGSNMNSSTLNKAIEGYSSLDRGIFDSVIVIARGLNQPRGLAFGPDLTLYVSESGTGGTISTVGQCEQVPPPVGPYLGGNNGSISRVNWFLENRRIATGLPSTQNAPTVGSDKTSIGDIAFYRGELYALLSGAGCSHGHPEIPNGILRINRNGSWQLIADISSFLKSHPVANPEEDDFEPDGDLYSMLRIGNSLYFIESNHGELDRYDFETGKISRVVDISASQGHIVPTAIAYRNGFFYVGNLGTIPFPQGSSKILKISRDGLSVTTFATGFTTILGLTFDLFGNLYVLESSIGNAQPPFFFPNTGRIRRISAGNTGNITEVATGLNFPTAMTLGPDGNLYVSNNGFASSPGQGQVLRVRIWPRIPFTINTLDNIN